MHVLHYTALRVANYSNLITKWNIMINYNPKIFCIRPCEYYCIRGNFHGMTLKFSLNRKQTGFSRLYFCGSQVHCGKVACYVLLLQTRRIKFLLYPYVTVKSAKFTYRGKFHAYSIWSHSVCKRNQMLEIIKCSHLAMYLN